MMIFMDAILRLSFLGDTFSKNDLILLQYIIVVLSFIDK